MLPEDPPQPALMVAPAPRDGKRWARLRQTDADYAVDVEVMEIELGEVVPVDPEIAYYWPWRPTPSAPTP